jgi:predicted dehydrogenase
LASHLRREAFPPWYFSREISGGGILLTNGVHAIDRARTLLKSDLVLNSAQLTKMYASYQCKDSAEIRFTTKGNVAVDISLSWLPYEPIGTGITVVGTQGSAQIAINDCWNITTIKETRSGGAIGIDVLRFRRQWCAFLAGTPGFLLSDLEPTLNQIESPYHDNSIDTTYRPE